MRLKGPELLKIIGLRLNAGRVAVCLRSVGIL